MKDFVKFPASGRGKRWRTKEKVSILLFFFESRNWFFIRPCLCRRLVSNPSYNFRKVTISILRVLARNGVEKYPSEKQCRVSKRKKELRGNPLSNSVETNIVSDRFDQHAAHWNFIPVVTARQDRIPSTTSMATFQMSKIMTQMGGSTQGSCAREEAMPSRSPYDANCR